MDLKKTGALISLKRKELGLTQKELADSLCISDRTVSKWERGAGFPDISLLEPLADALNLTVLELLHGQPEPPAPEQERSAREMLDYCRSQLAEQATRARQRMIFLGIILVLVLVLFPFILCTANGNWFHNQSISAEEAVTITPNILIRTEDYELLNIILSDEIIATAYNNYFSESLYLDGDAIAKYRKMVDIDGEAPLFFDILVSKDSITVKYGTQHIFICLTVHKGQVSKRIILHEFPYLTESGENIPLGQRHGKRIDLDNTDNIRFSTGGYDTGWL